MNSNLNRYYPTQEERWESLDLVSLVALLGGTVTREFSPAAPLTKDYILRTRSGLEIARVTFTQENCLWYGARLFNGESWANVAIFGNMECVETGW